ncbi:hypothetical protein [Arthrobacter sp. STN4]|uniref:hypothetical protein n=1 Tax=Arthrobacter sp. STN4 TaxID=2923276 RepID=UPI00211A95AE|nr:hypothetical protein [Arthrobacter sp. STN4]MCQ9163916.1 hypothetical protein [Arthrobacter sp. STN4]
MGIGPLGAKQAGDLQTAFDRFCFGLGKLTAHIKIHGIQLLDLRLLLVDGPVPFQDGVVELRGRRRILDLELPIVSGFGFP